MLRDVLCRAPYIAFKGFMAGTTAASSVKKAENGTASAKEKHYGQYTIWWDPNANQVGRQVDAPNAGTFERMQNCMEACDNDHRCAGITVQMTVHPGSPVNNVGPKTCKLVYGDTRPGVFQRTVVRMDPGRVEIPTYMKGEPQHILFSGSSMRAGQWRLQASLCDLHSKESLRAPKPCYPLPACTKALEV